MSELTTLTMFLSVLIMLTGLSVAFCIKRRGFRLR